MPDFFLLAQFSLGQAAAVERLNANATKPAIPTANFFIIAKGSFCKIQT
jgi:hypothetical protein